MGATASTVVQVFNVSKKTPLTIASLVVEGVDQTDFTIDAASAAAALASVLPPDQSASVAIVVTFTPRASGARTATLALASNAGTVAVALGASGLPQQPVAVFPADAITFLSGASAPATVSMTNAGGAPLILESIGFAGADPTSFQQVAVNRGAGNCFAGITLPPGSSCLIGVWYATGAVGPKSADLVVATNDPAHLSIDIPLTITAP
ncbi:MAG: choice-of-anchor D domain-containing protein [Anaeromyxobacteraceae bacterium]